PAVENSPATFIQHSNPPDSASTPNSAAPSQPQLTQSIKPFTERPKPAAGPDANTSQKLGSAPVSSNSDPHPDARSAESAQSQARESVISPQPQVMEPGLQKPVGRVPSRGETSDV